MRAFALSSIGRALSDVVYAEQGRPFAHSLAVVHAATGAEVLLKARIAEEHPLLIFGKLPTHRSTAEALTIQELFEHGRTVDYFALPDLLWAATGHRMVGEEEFRRFGHLRNRIVHFAVSDVDHCEATLRFCIEIIEPLVHHFWNDCTLIYAEEWMEEILSAGDLEEHLVYYGIRVPDCVNRGRRLRIRRVSDDS
jgi:hypothetical protein